METLCTATIGNTFATLVPSHETEDGQLGHLLTFTNLVTGKQISIRFQDEINAICAFGSWLLGSEDPEKLAARIASQPEVVSPIDFDYPD